MTSEPGTVCEQLSPRGDQGREILPGGLVDEDGTVHREVELRRLVGHDEEILTTVGIRSSVETQSPAALVTRILSRSVERIGEVRPVDEDVARRLLVADRQFLLLKLREVTFGDQVEGTLSCPWQGCGARVDIHFTIDDVPVTRRDDLRATYRLRLSPSGDSGGEILSSDAGSDSCRSVTFRLPDGGDQEAVAPHLDEGAGALTRLLERCVLEIETEDGDVLDVGAESGRIELLSPRARLEIEREMAAQAPAVELEMDVLCRDCGRGFTAPFDVQDFFFGELRTSRDLLYRQVHYLAWHYHWSEKEILDMPREKRQSYIDILADEIEAMNSEATGYAG